MKKLALALVMLGSFIAMSSVGHALVKVVKTCQTADGLYRVSVLDNQGLGPVRESNLSATVYNANGDELASYAVKSNANEIKSASTYQLMYTDTGTGGEGFLLAFGSTNFRHITLKALLTNGPHSGTKISEVDPSCK